MAKSVKVYSTPTCPFCIKTKQFLKDNNIRFEDIDGEIIVGFDRKKISKALGL